MGRFKALVFIAATAALAGCVTSPPARIDKELQGVPIEEAGFLSGSVSQQLSGESLAPFNDQTLYLTVRGAKPGARLSFSTGLFETPVDFSDEEARGAVFRIPLPPGDYDIVGVSFYWNNGTVERRWSNSQPFALPVRVRKGRTTYIGEYRAMGIWSRSLVGLKLPAGGYFVVSDGSERDLAILEAREPGFDAGQVDLAVPMIPAHLHSLLRPGPKAAAATP